VHYFLIFAILVVGGGLYYQYDLQDKQIKGLKADIGKLVADNNLLSGKKKGLEVDKAALTREIADAKVTIPDLTKQVDDAKKEADTVKAALDQTQALIAAAKAAQDKEEKALDAAQHGPPTNMLGEIVTLDGRKFESCFLTGVTADSITVKTATGFANILYAFLPGNLQVKFGYNVHLQLELTPDQVKNQEAIRIQNGSN
jgi:chromosome segregation ATPase